MGADVVSRLPERRTPQEARIKQILMTESAAAASTAARSLGLEPL
jgi:hypothetical protein